VTARGPAPLRMTRPTTEGDPIIDVYNSTSDGTVEIVADTRADNFGPKQITRTTCTGITPLRGWFDFASCGEPVVLSAR
jgi:hypothetical protein